MLTFFTDPHLANSAKSHTTNKSSKALDNQLYSKALFCTQIHPDDFVYCAGDLFDHSHNSEQAIMQGIDVALRCNYVLSGNHDLPNRENVRSSLELVDKATGNVIRCATDEVFIHEVVEQDVRICSIPHHSSQQLFDKAIKKALKTQGDLLILHCNFNNGLAVEDTSLNLDLEQAEKLLKKFKYIVLGHEHQHRWEMDGRVLILGNTHPTNFGDIGDKFVWRYDPTNTESPWSSTCIWSKSQEYIEVSAQHLIEDHFHYNQETFIEITGYLDPEDMPKLAHEVGELWKHSENNTLFMVRNNVSVHETEHESVQSIDVLHNICTEISQELKESPLLGIWEHHLKKVGM